MATEFEFRLDCATCGFVSTWAEATPTECPNDASHSIAADSTASFKSRDTASFVSSGALVGEEAQVTEDSVWQKIAEKSTNTQALLFTTGHLADLGSCYGRVTIKARVVGTGAQVKLVERDEVYEVESDLMESPSSVPDTESKHAISKHNTDVRPGAGDKTYILYARLNGATSFFIDNASLTLIGTR